MRGCGMRTRPSSPLRLAVSTRRSLSISSNSSGSLSSLSPTLRLRSFKTLWLHLMTSCGSCTAAALQQQQRSSTAVRKLLLPRSCTTGCKCRDSAATRTTSCQVHRHQPACKLPIPHSRVTCRTLCSSRHSIICIIIRNSNNNVIRSRFNFRLFRRWMEKQSILRLVGRIAQAGEDSVQLATSAVGLLQRMQRRKRCCSSDRQALQQGWRTCPASTPAPISVLVWTCSVLPWQEYALLILLYIFKQVLRRKERRWRQLHLQLFICSSHGHQVMMRKLLQQQQQHAADWNMWAQQPTDKFQKSYSQQEVSRAGAAAAAAAAACQRLRRRLDLLSTPTWNLAHVKAVPMIHKALLLG